MAIPVLSRLLLAAGLALSAWAQLPKLPGTGAPAAPDAPSPKTDPLGRGTPRSTVVSFLRAIGAQDYNRASKYLQTEMRGAPAEHLAMQLGAVLNGRSSLDIEQLSNQESGSPNDDSRPDRDMVGVVKSPTGPVEIVLDRVKSEGGLQIWLFSADTLKDMPQLYASTGSNWLEASLPESLKYERFLGVLLWRWMLWLAGFLISFVGSALLQSVLRLAWKPILHRLDPDHPQPVPISLGGPLRVFLFGLIVSMLSPFAATILARQFWFRVGATVAIFSGGWVLSRVIDAWSSIASHRLHRRTGALYSSSIWLMQRAAKVGVALIGFLLLLKLGDFELTGVLAGLGIGGLAFAFAAQKTIENLFGGVMITTDQSIRVGDTCRVGDVTGTIIDIGIRSTRIRTMNRTIVSIPNGQTAAVSIENFSERDKYHCLHVIGVRYETNAESMRGILKTIPEVLSRFEEVEKETIRVRFIRFGPSSLDIEIRAYIFAPGFDQFLERQENILLTVMETLESRGVGIAFPSQTLYIAKEA